MSLKNKHGLHSLELNIHTHTLTLYSHNLLQYFLKFVTISTTGFNPRIIYGCMT